MARESPKEPSLRASSLGPKNRDAEAASRFSGVPEAGVALWDARGRDPLVEHPARAAAAAVTAVALAAMICRLRMVLMLLSLGASAPSPVACCVLRVLPARLRLRAYASVQAALTMR
jgi:hypothetical protein